MRYTCHGRNPISLIMWGTTFRRPTSFQNPCALPRTCKVSGYKGHPQQLLTTYNWQPSEVGKPTATANRTHIVAMICHDGPDQPGSRHVTVVVRASLRPTHSWLSCWDRPRWCVEKHRKPGFLIRCCTSMTRREAMFHLLYHKGVTEEAGSLLHETVIRVAWQLVESQKVDA